VTLLTTSQEILKQTESANIPTTIIGNLQPEAVQILQAMTNSITEISRAYDWQELQKEETFATVASTEGYALPSDFDRFIDTTFWNTSTNLSVLGPESPQNWRILKNSTASNATASDWFRIRDDNVLLFPIPSGIENFIYEYITDLIVKSSGDVGQITWLADADVPTVDEYMIKLDATWRFKAMKGQPYAEEQRTAVEAAAERASRNGAKRVIRHHDRTTINKANIGYPDLIIAP